MRKDDILISLLSHVELSDNELDRIKGLFKENLDWDYILNKSKNEGVPCLIYQHLRNLPFKDSIPEGILESFKNIYYTNSARNASIYEETKRVLKAFHTEKIKIVILKGIFLAESIYKNITLRPMTDIDILLKKEDVLKASKILSSLGYSTDRNCEAVLRQPFSYSLTFSPSNPEEADSFCIDLHWHILSSTWLMGFLADKIDMERIWEQAEPTKIDDVDTLTLSPAHLLLYLAQHGFVHSFKRLILLTDILETLRHYQRGLVWDKVIEEAKDLELLNVLSYSLDLTVKRLGLNLPERETAKLRQVSHRKNIFPFFITVSPCLAYILLQSKLKDRLKFAAKAAYLFKILS